MTELPPMATGGAPALGLALLNLLLSMLPDLVARNWQAVRSFGPGGVTVFNRIALTPPGSNFQITAPRTPLASAA